ncbi:MAG: ABC transporter ATP-binding protein [Bacteroidota bacterium]
MKTYLRLLSYASPLGKYAIPFFIFSLLSVLFGIANLTLIIPLLKVLFQKVTSDELKEMLQKPAVSWNVKYLVKSFYYYFGHFIQQYGKLGALKFVCFFLIVSVLLANVFKYISQRILENARAHTVAQLRQAVFDKAVSLHLGFFSNERKGNLISRLTTDVQEVENSIAASFTGALKEPMIIITYFVALFAISVQLTLFTLIIIPLSGLSIASLAKKLKKDAKAGQQSLGSLISIIDETFSGMRVVKGFNAASFIKDKFRKENQFYNQMMRSMAKKRELASPMSEFLGVTVIAIVLLYGGSLILSNEPGSGLTAEAFLVYIAIFSQVTRPIKDISNAFSYVQRGIASGERIFELMDTPPSVVDKPKAIKLNHFDQAVEFRNVSFQYENGVKILKDISFTMQKGKTIALVGPSGGGKSTIADLLPRFYDPTTGSILIDGKDLRDCEADSIRAQMGIVTQESILFNDTIFNNIAFGIQATEEEVIFAAKVANAHQFIVETPEGYYTVIGDRGTKLSGGQRQRISIARAVLRNPSILILDEATSALDTESEKLVQEALANLMQNRTSLVIAHRLSTIQNADEILVIQAGQIVEKGNHEDLLELEQGVYKKLNSMQAL